MKFRKEMSEKSDRITIIGTNNSEDDKFKVVLINKEEIDKIKHLGIEEYKTLAEKDEEEINKILGKYMK